MGRFNVGGAPGIHVKQQTQEKQIWWMHENLRVFDNLPKIVSTAVDSTNTPTTDLRSGLVLGKVTSSGKWKQYDPTATDGSQQAQGVLLGGVRMMNVVSGVVEDKDGEVLVGGFLKAGQLIGLDSAARIQLAQRFVFDDDLVGRGWGGPLAREVSKAADYVVVAADNMTEFVATAAVNFTLPAIGKGYRFKFRQTADANMGVVSAEGDNMIGMNDASADSATFSTSSQKIGAALNVYSNLAGDKWIIENVSAGANAVTLAT